MWTGTACLAEVDVCAPGGYLVMPIVRSSLFYLHPSPPLLGDPQNNPSVDPNKGGQALLRAEQLHSLRATSGVSGWPLPTSLDLSIPHVSGPGPFCCTAESL